MSRSSSPFGLHKERSLTVYCKPIANHCVHFLNVSSLLSLVPAAEIFEGWGRLKSRQQLPSRASTQRAQAHTVPNSGYLWIRPVFAHVHSLRHNQCSRHSSIELRASCLIANAFDSNINFSILYY